MLISEQCKLQYSALFWLRFDLKLHKQNRSSSGIPARQNMPPLLDFATAFLPSEPGVPPLTPP